MDIFTDIARRMDSDKLETLARFRAAAKEHKPLRAGLNDLPSGFLAGVGFDGELHALFVLNPFGMLVARAAETLTKENAA
jgi:hypothetical protein